MNSDVLEASAKLPHTAAQSRPRGCTGHQNGVPKHTFGSPRHTCPWRYVIVVPSENHTIYCIFVTLSRWWQVFFGTWTRLRPFSNTQCQLFSLLVRLGSKKMPTGVSRALQRRPKMPKWCPRETQMHSKRDLGALEGVFPDVSELPPKEKYLKSDKIDLRKALLP